MLRKITPKKKKIMVKNLIIDSSFKVHPLAETSFQIYCEHIEPKFFDTNAKIKSNKQILVDVIEENNTSYFFDNFSQVILLQQKQQITVRALDIAKVDIERRAWDCLLESFLIEPQLNPVFLQRIINTIPDFIIDEQFERKLTINKLLEKRGLALHQYNYRLKKAKDRQPHELPSFSELIAEVRHAID